MGLFAAPGYLHDGSPRCRPADTVNILIGIIDW